MDGIEIDIDAGTPGTATFTAIEPTVEVEDSLNYRCFYAYADPDTGVADKIVGLTLDGNARTFTGIELSPANGATIQNAISALIATEGYACEKVEFKVHQAQANGRKTSISIIIIGSSIVVDSVELDIDAGTPDTAPFVTI